MVATLVLRFLFFLLLAYCFFVFSVSVRLRERGKVISKLVKERMILKRWS